MSEANKSVLEALRDDLHHVEYSLSYSRTMLVTALAALSSLFLAIASTIQEHTELHPSDVIHVAPYFVAVMLFGYAVSVLKSVYLASLAPKVGEYLKSSVPKPKFYPETLALEVVCVFGVVACGSTIYDSFGQPWRETTMVVILFGVSILFFALEFVANLDLRYFKKILEHYEELARPDSWSAGAYVSFTLYFLMGTAAVFYSWHSLNATLFLTLSAMAYLALQLISLAFSRYGEIVNNGLTRDAILEFRHWILIEQPDGDKVSEKYREFVGRGQ